MLVEFTFSASQTCNDIELDVKYLDQCWHVPCTTDAQNISFEIANHMQDQPQQIFLSMTGKSAAHTSIDSQGNIVNDIVMKVNSIVFDQIDVTDIFCSGQLIYTHDCNGNVPTFVDEFYGIIGCNGIIQIDFSTPIHLWFLKQI